MLNNLAMARYLDMMDKSLFDSLLESCRRGPVHRFQRMRVLWFAESNQLEWLVEYLDACKLTRHQLGSCLMDTYLVGIH